MNRNSLNGNVHINITTKAQYRGLCPDRRDIMVLMERSLFNEVALQTDVPTSNDAIISQHWLDRLDACIDQLRAELVKAPAGCRSLDVAVYGLDIRVVTKRLLNKHVLALSLARPARLTA